MFNEEHRVEAGLAGLDRLRALLGGDVEAVLVDDGSTDGTLARARERQGALVLAEPHRGKGGALRAGVARTTGDRVLVADVDWSVAPTQIPAMLAQDADVVVATREGPGARRIGEPSWRHLMGRAFNWAVQIGLLAGHHDTQCGFKVFEGNVARDLFSRLTIEGWAYDVELLFLAHHLGHTVREVPVVWRYEADSRLRPIADGLGMAREIRQVQRNARNGVYRRR